MSASNCPSLHKGTDKGHGKGASERSGSEPRAHLRAEGASARSRRSLPDAETERAGEAARERACKGVRRVKPFGERNEWFHSSRRRRSEDSECAGVSASPGRTRGGR